MDSFYEAALRDFEACATELACLESFQREERSSRWAGAGAGVLLFGFLLLAEVSTAQLAPFLLIGVPAAAVYLWMSLSTEGERADRRAELVAQLDAAFARLDARRTLVQAS